MNRTGYDNYKIIKDKLNYTYKGYNIQSLVAGYLNFVFDEIAPSSRDVFKAFYQSLTSIDLKKVPETQSKTIITYLINRADYRNLSHATQGYYKGSEVIDLSSLPKIKFSLFNPFYTWHLFKALRIVFFRSVGNSMASKLNIVAIIVLIFNQIRLIEKAKRSGQIEQYICFNSSYKEESLLTMYFNKNKIETITLQHGIFCDFKLLIPFDYINFENRLAKKVLSWGQATFDYFKTNGIDSSELIMFGNPKYKDVKIDKVYQTFKHCLVLLGRGLYIDTNNKLLQLLTEYNQKNNNNIVFYIKKHPFLLDEDHRQFADVSKNIIFLGKEHSVEEILKSSLVDFSISVNTTAYYESLALGKPCLRWTESENEDFYGIDDKFIDLHEFEYKLNSLQTMNQAVIVRDIQNVIRYIFNPDLQTKNVNSYEN